MTASTVDYSTLQENFHLPISDVAKKLGICTTVLKKICRNYDIPRWPYRQIKSIDKAIADLERTTPTNDIERTQKDIELKALHKRKQGIINNPKIIGPTYSHLSTIFKQDPSPIRSKSLTIHAPKVISTIPIESKDITVQYSNEYMSQAVNTTPLVLPNFSSVHQKPQLPIKRNSQQNPHITLPFSSPQLKRPTARGRDKSNFVTLPPPHQSRTEARNSLIVQPKGRSLSSPSHYVLNAPRTVPLMAPRAQKARKP